MICNCQKTEIIKPGETNIIDLKIKIFLPKYKNTPILIGQLNIGLEAINVFNIEIKHYRSFIEKDGKVYAFITNKSNEPVTLKVGHYYVSMYFIEPGYPDNHVSIGPGQRKRRLEFYAKEIKFEKLPTNEVTVINYTVTNIDDYLPQPRLSLDHKHIDLQLAKEITLKPRVSTNIHMNIHLKFMNSIEGHLNIAKYFRRKYNLELAHRQVIKSEGWIEIICHIINHSDGLVVLTQGSYPVSLYFTENNIKHPNSWLSPEERSAVLQHYALLVALEEKFPNKCPEKGHKNSNELNQTQLNLIEMASHSSISATSYGLNVKMGNQPLSCYTVDNPNLRVGLD